MKFLIAITLALAVGFAQAGPGTVTIADSDIYTPLDSSVSINWVDDGEYTLCNISIADAGDLTASIIIATDVTCADDTYAWDTTTFTVTGDWVAQVGNEVAVASSPPFQLCGPTNPFNIESDFGAAVYTVGGGVPSVNVTGRANCDAYIPTAAAYLQGIVNPVEFYIGEATLDNGIYFINSTDAVLPPIPQDTYTVVVTDYSDRTFRSVASGVEICNPDAVDFTAPTDQTSVRQEEDLVISWVRSGCVVNTVDLQIWSVQEAEDEESEDVITQLETIAEGVVTDAVSFSWEVPSDYEIGTYRIVAVSGAGEPVDTIDSESGSFTIRSNGALANTAPQTAFLIGLFSATGFGFLFCVLVFIYGRPTKKQLLQREVARTATMTTLRNMELKGAAKEAREAAGLAPITGQDPAPEAPAAPSTEGTPLVTAGEGEEKPSE